MSRVVRRAKRHQPVLAVRARLLASVLPLALALWGCAPGPDEVEHQPDDAAQADGQAPAPTRYVFDPTTVATLSGTVLAVQTFQRMQGTRYGVRAKLDVDGERIYVYLGPQGYLGGHGLSLSAGDELEVRGSVLGEDGRRIVIATEVVAGDKTFVLRDDEGRPLWRGGQAGKDQGRQQRAG